jgi:hypothetical protein
MLGTDRAIQDFSLEIHPIDNLAENERCTAWGTVAFTSEVDFRTETTADCVVFYLFVRSDRFLRYATQVAKGLVDEILLRVSRVPGLYSDWSPSVSTRDVKILTMGDEQAVALPSGVSFDLPRLGLIGSATLYFNRRIAWDLPLSEDTELQEPEKSGERVDIPIDRLRDPAALQSGKLDALVRLARFAVVLLALLCLIAFLKR